MMLSNLILQEQKWRSSLALWGDAMVMVAHLFGVEGLTPGMLSCSQHL